jgi:hypothetical protein
MILCYPKSATVVIILPNHALLIISNNLEGTAQKEADIDANEQKKNREDHFVGLVSFKLKQNKTLAGSTTISTFIY